MNKIFFHISEPPVIPVDTVYDSIINIDNYQDNTIDYILIGDLLDYYDDNHTHGILQLILNKINKNGYLEIQAPDIGELCISSASSRVDIQTIKEVLKNRKTLHTIYDIDKLLDASKITISKKRYVNIFEYYILAQKNEI